jgi:uncharacterized protein (DUF427 family)
MAEMKTPGPDHPITLEAAKGRLQAAYSGHVIADSENVVMLREATYPPVAYFPRADVEMAFLARTSHRTHCPYKGDAAYFTLDMDGHIAENAVWSYEDPYEAMTAIREMIAFYPNVVEIRPVAGSVPDVDVEAVVLHTDAGDGTTQAPHWAPTVDEPLL